VAPLPRVDLKVIWARAKAALFTSRFARKLDSTKRTLEKWEQGRAKPNSPSGSPGPVGSRLTGQDRRLERVPR
jgi:hypothetical protein